MYAPAPLLGSTRRRRILDAARDVFLERGLNAPLDLIVRRAGVGPGTLYRRYQDRETLVRDLTGDLLARLKSAAYEAAAFDDDAFAVVRRFLHAAADLRKGAVILVLLEGLIVDQQLVRVRTRAAQTVEALIDAAHQAGQLRRDVGMGGHVLLSIRRSRRIPGGQDRLNPTAPSSTDTSTWPWTPDRPCPHEPASAAGPS
ncbi:TetR/AcrR family transcriptional regulator [Streptomyces xanthochromogenes]|uniref:TetR/AcrR family transcriptional regulator n=1 Tax=Streptomyces xanthochromogenes TaxID=67384 RepID=UPI00382CC755